MGRKERRKAERTGLPVKKEKVYTMTESQLRERSKKDILHGTKQGWNVCLLFILSALHDRHGFGRKRLEDVCDSIQDKLELFNEGYVNMQDLYDTLHEETGIVLEITGVTKAVRK